MNTIQISKRELKELLPEMAHLFKDGGEDIKVPIDKQFIIDTIKKTKGGYHPAIS